MPATNNMFDSSRDEIDQAARIPEKGAQKRAKRDVHGWVVLDKPVGMTSTHAVAVIKRLFSAKRAGHAGTLDPLASGCLPIACGEATKTVPFVVDGRKTYIFTVRWGEERDTDDAEGRVINTSASRPQRAAIEAMLPRFTGTIDSCPFLMLLLLAGTARWGLLTLAAWRAFVLLPRRHLPHRMRRPGKSIPHRQPCPHTGSTRNHWRSSIICSVILQMAASGSRQGTGLGRAGDPAASE